LKICLKIANAVVQAISNVNVCKIRTKVRSN
jgi:hypothetical protein